MTCVIRICLMTGECVAGLLFEGFGASKRTRKSVQKLGAEEPQLKAALLLCPCLLMALKDPLSPSSMHTDGVHQPELVFQCFPWAKNALS